MAIYNVSYINEISSDKTPTRVTLEDAKKARDILKKFLWHYDIPKVKKTMVIIDDKKIEKSIRNSKDPAIAIYKPSSEAIAARDFSNYKKSNPSKSNLDKFKNDFINVMKTEGLNYSLGWKRTIFGTELLLK